MDPPEPNFVNASIPFMYSEYGFGVLYNTGNPVSVDNTYEVPLFVSDFGLTIEHENYLHNHFVVLPNIRVHNRFDFELNVYLHDHLLSKGINPFMRCTIENDLVTKSYVPEPFRKIIRGLISFISYLHSRNVSLATDLDFRRNFVVKNDIVKYWRIAFRTVENGSKANDFFMVLKIILQLLGLRHEQPVHEVRSSANLPYDMRCLLRRLYNYRDADDFLLENHVATMSHHERYNFIRSCDEQFEFLEGQDKADYQRAVQRIGIGRDWTRRISRPSPNNLPTGGVTHCLRHGYNGTVPFEIYLSGRYQDGSTSDFLRNAGVLKMCRNLVVHIVEKKYYRVEIVEKKHVELMIMELFGPELVLFQENVHNSGLLRTLIYK